MIQNTKSKSVNCEDCNLLTEDDLDVGVVVNIPHVSEPNSGLVNKTGKSTLDRRWTNILLRSSDVNNYRGRQSVLPPQLNNESGDIRSLSIPAAIKESNEKAVWNNSNLAISSTKVWVIQPCLGASSVLRSFEANNEWKTGLISSLKEISVLKRLSKMKTQKNNRHKSILFRSDFIGLGWSLQVQRKKLSSEILKELI